MADAIDLQQFCSRGDDLREHLRSPWAHKGWRYGCNGHILVRVPSAADAEAVATHSVAEKGAALVEKVTKTEGYILLPTFPAPKVCIGCGGDGRRLMVKCEDCDGEGYFDYGRHEYQCKECEGDGLLDADETDEGAAMHDCPECGGYGYQRAPALVGGVHFDVVYLRLLANLPSLRICPNGDEAAHFTFDGGEGVLMPRRP